MKRVLLTGADGQLGHELRRQLPHGTELMATSSQQLDITDAEKIAQVVGGFAPRLIINAAAYTAVDQAEQDCQRAYAVNADAVALLARQAQQAGIAMLHVSTDYVFDGHKQQPYLEQDQTAPASVYGASKLAGEQVLARILPQHVILRTSWVFGVQGNNFVKTMLRLAATRDELSVVADQRGCPTSAASLAQTIWQLAGRYLGGKELPWGIYHFCNAPACSWHEFAVEIFRQAQAAGLLVTTPVVTPIAGADYPAAAPRPAYSVLDCRKLEQLLGQQVPQWQQELALVLQQLKMQQERSQTNKNSSNRPSAKR